MTTSPVRSVLLNLKYEVTAPKVPGKPAGTDKMAARVTVAGGYQTEEVYANGQLIRFAQYPAGTDYAAKRVAKLAK